MQEWVELLLYNLAYSFHVIKFNVLFELILKKISGRKNLNLLKNYFNFQTFFDTLKNFHKQQIYFCFLKSMVPKIPTEKKQRVGKFRKKKIGKFGQATRNVKKKI